MHCILKQNNESLIYKVFQAILENPVKNDWVSSAKKTIEEFNLNMTFSEIKHIDTKKFKYIVRQKSFQKSFEYLKMEQMKHSKSKHFIFEKFEIQDYLLPDINISNEDRKFLISLQCRMIEIKSNFPSKYKDLTCEAGCGENETMNHIMRCNILQDKYSENNEVFENIYTCDINKKLIIMNIFKNNLNKRRKTIHERRQISDTH